MANMKAALAIALVFVGCCSNVVFLELLVKIDPGSGNLITFLQFLFIALEGFLFTSKCGTVRPRIGLKDYTILVVMFFVASVCNNYAFDFNIPMPLHMIFRAGSLIANMVMGILILKKRYDFSKYLSVGMISTGIVICTIVSGTKVESTQVLKNAADEDPVAVFFWWTLGIALLTLALFVSARMGLYQEVLYKRYGKHPKEALFYTHLLPLPFFALLAGNIWEHIQLANASPLQPIPVLGVSLPITWLYLLGNVLTQYVCISSVYVLTTECSSLTVTLVVTLRKFVSLLFSIVYFSNPFTVHHWIGTILVFVGTIIFTEVVGKVRAALSSGSEEKKKVNYNVLDDNEIQGEEDGAARIDGETKFTPFNMKEEMEEGHFDADGHYLWKKQVEVKDHWLDNIDWVKLKNDPNYKERPDKGEDRGLADSDSDEDDEEGGGSKFDDIGTYQQMLELMEPKETVKRALQRLGKGTAKLTTAQRWKLKKEGKSPDEVSAKITKLTALSNDILTNNGNMDVYEETFEMIQKKVTDAEKKRAAAAGPDDELDMYADDFGSREQSKLGTDAGKDKEGTASASDEKDKEEEEKKPLMWEYKEEQEAETIHGPYTSEQMQKFADEGRFSSGAFVRKVDNEDARFYSAARIDFDLYL
uniref:GYF domain-containing protein n=1 Tax=Anopheles epiroticus TaxID=199890 RepID=A0A182PVC9_9DIPT